MTARFIVCCRGHADGGPAPYELALTAYVAGALAQHAEFYGDRDEADRLWSLGNLAGSMCAAKSGVERWMLELP
ncbi:MAG: hypothetical protein F4060_02580 [Holophagales bacterium]|nr:hypothetical protein [Holophagales bacterium]MYI78803.1 hypothetical protein [Holophagales bacterium]